MLTTRKFVSSKIISIIESYNNIFYGVLLLFACSQLCIPLDPIPVTLQTVGVMIVGLLFARRDATLTILVYLCLGAVGIPVFAKFNSGLQCLFGHGGGYLWGFLIAVIVMSSVKKNIAKLHTRHLFLNCFLGTIIILLCGVFWLACHIGLGAAIKSGLYPFIIPGIIKILLATVVVRYLCHTKLMFCRKK